MLRTKENRTIRTEENQMLSGEIRVIKDETNTEGESNKTSENRTPGRDIQARERQEQWR